MIDNQQIANLLSSAAEVAHASAAYNSETQATIRASRAGLPLLQQFIEDRVVPELPHKERERYYSKKHPDFQYHDPDMNDIQTAISISTGYVFEQVVGACLRKQYPNCVVSGNTELDYDGLKGHCDWLTINHTEKIAIVTECKAIKTYSAREAIAEKLMVDNYGYFSQLSIYLAAVSKLYPDYEVRGEWRVWAKRVDKSYKIDYPGNLELALEVAGEAMVKRSQYQKCVVLWEENQLDELASYLWEVTEELPEKHFKGGFYRASCGFHFSVWSDLFVDKHGFMLDDAPANLLLLLKCAKHKNENDCQLLEQLLDKVKA